MNIAFRRETNDMRIWKKVGDCLHLLMIQKSLRPPRVMLGLRRFYNCMTQAWCRKFICLSYDNKELSKKEIRKIIFFTVTSIITEREKSLAEEANNINIEKYKTLSKRIKRQKINGNTFFLFMGWNLLKCSYHCRHWWKDSTYFLSKFNAIFI